MKWWSSMSSPLPCTKVYETVDNKEKAEIRIELKQCSVYGDDQSKPNAQNNFFTHLQNGISVDEEVTQFLTRDLKSKHPSSSLNYSKLNASKRCREVLNFFLLNTFNEGLKYILLFNIAFFVVLMIKQRNAACLGIVILLALVTSAMLTVTHFKVYNKHQVSITVMYAMTLCVASLSQFAVRQSYTEPSLYASSTTVLILLYTVLPLPGLATIIIAVSYTLLFEVCYLLTPSDRDTRSRDVCRILSRIVLQGISHILGIYVTHQYQAHSRCLIYNITKLAMAKEKLRRERKLKQRVISSVMPASIGRKLVNIEQTQLQEDHIFRPMVMHYLKNVSILFADIVGFTSMSSKRSAIEIVSMLNIICDSFDRLTTDAGCTKISTLGDCYYCVAGCPEKMIDHAPTIVELSLKMLSAIDEINQEADFNVAIRVGIHTGSVLCGVVGIKRFRFDVWSHDVLRANEMEASGMPGKVHISDTTFQLIKDKFMVVDALAHTRSPNMDGMKTYFVIGKHDNTQPKVQPLSRKGKSRCNMFKLRFYSSSEGQSSVKSIDDPYSRFKSFSLTSCDMKSRDDRPETILTTSRNSFSEAICTDRKVTDTEVMSQIIHTKSRSAFSARRNLSIVTLQFHDSSKELLYRQASVARHSSDEKGTKKPGMGFLTDVIISVLFLICCGAVVLLSLPFNKYWFTGFMASFALELVVLLSLSIFMRTARKATDSTREMSLSWIARNIISAGLLFLPFAVVTLRVYVSRDLSCDDVDVLVFLYFTALLHGINFLQVLGLMKILLLLLMVCVVAPLSCITRPFRACYTGNQDPEYKGYQVWDVPISLLLFLKLICMVIRTFELRIRLNFSSSVEAERDQKLHKKLRDQAYWLLENLIPRHVLMELKKSGSYHRDHSSVAVCFASIVNFQDFFDAKWRHGHESIRILNELISDIDELLDIPKYHTHIEKIKTALGCTYMAASGLVQEDPDHIFVMMQFLFDIKKVLSQFNKNTMGFEFKMKYGCHVGPVASGVIGQSAPMFDIWGDTVNIASRMMTTGVIGKIQVLQETADIIKPRYELEKRGIVFVKGKGDVETYFVLKETTETLTQ